MNLLNLFTFALIVGLSASRSTHKCNGTTPKDRTCVFTDLCVSSDGKSWEYFTDASTMTAADRELLSGDIAVLGAGAKAPMFRVKIVSAEGPGADKPIEQRTAAVFCGSTVSSYSQWVLDDLFSVHWLVSTHVGRKMKAVDVVHGCIRKSSMSDVFSGLLSEGDPVTMAKISGKCYGRVIVGSSGKFLLSNPGAVSDADIAAFRESLWAAAGAQEEHHDPKKASLVQRRGDRVITNGVELYDAIGGACPSAELLFVENLPFGGQVQAAAGAGLVISTHGGALANMIFMRPGSAVLELFPYGYDSPKYRHLAEKVGIRYESWHNTDRSAAVFHEGLLDRYGIYGAARLAITNADKWDPSTMPATARAYWADQDTRVDIETVAKLSKMLIEAGRPIKEEKKEL